MKVVSKIRVALRDGRVVDNAAYLLVNNPRSYTYAIYIEIMDTVTESVDVYESYLPNFFGIMQIMQPYGFIDGLSRDNTSAFIAMPRQALKFLELVDDVKCRTFYSGHELVERWKEDNWRILKSKFTALDEYNTLFRGTVTRDRETAYNPYWSLYNVCRDVKSGWFEDKFYFPQKRVYCGLEHGESMYDVVAFEVCFNDVSKARALLAKEIMLNPLAQGIRG